MKLKYLFIALLTSIIFACDDTTGNLGTNIMPDADKPPVGFQLFNVTTQSLLTDSVYARSSIAYLGKYTDPSFGVFEADFMTQFYCPPGFKLALPREQIVGVDDAGNARNLSTNIFLFYNKDGFYGDSLSPCRLSIYELDKILEENKENYYTNIDPANFYNPNGAPLGVKAYSAVNMSIPDSIRNKPKNRPGVFVKLPSNEIGSRIIRLAKEHPEYFANSDEFTKNVFKGIYVKSDHGDGTILYINQITLEIRADCYVDSAGVFPIKRKQKGFQGQDSIAQAAIAKFGASKEVIQANHFQNKGKIKELVDDKNCTYIKSPAGLITEATLPINTINERLPGDTLNSVKVTFTNYNNTSSNSKFKMVVPENLLMVRKKEMYTFFEKDKVADNITSYLVSHDSKNNEYNFTNISSLVITCINEKLEGEKKDPDWAKKAENKDWDKVVLIPVTIIKDGNNSVISIRNNLDITSVRLKGGLKEGNQLKMEILYSTIKK